MRLSTVSATPFFAVSECGGHFELKGCRLASMCWERSTEAGEQTLTVTIPAKKVRRRATLRLDE